MFRSPTDRLGHEWSVAAVRCCYFFVFKCVVEDSSLTDQRKSWYELESYGAFKQIDALSAADKLALSILTSETVHNGERNIVPMLWIDSNVNLPNNYYSSLAQFKTLEEMLSEDPELRERYVDTIREDIRKGYVVTVELHDPRKRSDHEWYLPNHPVVNPNKPGNILHGRLLGFVRERYPCN